MSRKLQGVASTTVHGRTIGGGNTPEKATGQAYPDEGALGASSTDFSQHRKLVHQKKPQESTPTTPFRQVGPSRQPRSERYKFLYHLWKNRAEERLTIEDIYVNALGTAQYEDERKGRCPFHPLGKKSKPSLRINPDKKTYFCRSDDCNAKGGPLDFWEAIITENGGTAEESLCLLLRAAGVSPKDGSNIPRTPMPQVEFRRRT